MDVLSGLERGLPVAKRPRAGLVLTCGEEHDQSERVLQALHDLVESGRSLAVLGSLVRRKLGELELQLQVDPREAVDDGNQRFRGERLELGGQLAPPLRERASGFEMHEQLLQARDLLSFGQLAGLRFLADLLEPALDVITVGQEELELDRLEVAGWIGVGREAVRDREQRVRLAKPAEQRAPPPRHVDDANRGRRHLVRADDMRDLVEARVGDSGDADIRLLRHRGISGNARARVRQRVEERRLARVREADDPGLKRQAR